MKRIVSIFIVAVVFVGLAGCGNKNNESKPPIIETKSFVYISTTDSYKGVVDDIYLLNQWLQNNPGKKVVCFSGVLAYREGVSGYIVYFVSGDNSKQKFERIRRNDNPLQKPAELAVHGIRSLQEWKNIHMDARIIGIASIPAYSGGVREFTICYEQP
ncbi:MAG: hypothetical protein NT155_03035 [Candidatus Staskawiczbacteria bacterium]|nr:hypothetical protein [Candidatus Staskawiczbacteria bacterium]